MPLAASDSARSCGKVATPYRRLSIYLKNTAGQNLGFSLVNCCGVAITGASVTATRSIDGGAQSSATGTVSDLGNGQYNLEMSQADTNGNHISFLFRATNAVQVEKSIDTTLGSYVNGAGGIHFTNPWEFLPLATAAANVAAYDSSSTAQDSTTTAFFDEMDRRGVKNTWSGWTANTYQTLLDVSSGKGLVANLIGPTAGSSAVTTFKFTIDGAPEVEIPVGVVSGNRAILTPGLYNFRDYNFDGNLGFPGAETLNAGKTQFTNTSSVIHVLPWRTYRGTPLLRFNSSIKIEAKHSANITNSTATAYSAVMYRLGL